MGCPYRDVNGDAHFCPALVLLHIPNRAPIFSARSRISRRPRCESLSFLNGFGIDSQPLPRTNLISRIPVSEFDLIASRCEPPHVGISAGSLVGATEYLETYWNVTLSGERSGLALGKVDVLPAVSPRID